MVTFSRVSLIRKPQSTSDVDHFHARDLHCSRVKFHDNPISNCGGDSADPYSFIYIDEYYIVVVGAHKVMDKSGSI